MTGDTSSAPEGRRTSEERASSVVDAIAYISDLSLSRDQASRGSDATAFAHHSDVHMRSSSSGPGVAESHMERNARHALEALESGDCHTPERNPTPSPAQGVGAPEHLDSDRSSSSARPAPSESGSEALATAGSAGSLVYIASGKQRASGGSERSTESGVDSPAMRFGDQMPLPWHPTGIFATLQAVPKERSMRQEHWRHIMFHDTRRVYSLEDEDLLFKYGPWFLRTYRIKRSSCIGVGSTATVYSGEMDGKRVAFKVMNQSKTAPNASLFLDRSVLTELEVHHLLQQSLEPAACKHLLVILDCQIYPPLHPVFAAIEANMPKASAAPPASTGAFELGQSADQDDGELYTPEDQGSADPTASSEMKFQVIMVSPLCELGGFLKLCQGRLNLPTRAVPRAALRAVVERLSPRHYKGLVESVGLPVAPGENAAGRYSLDSIVTHLVEKWGVSHRAIMRASQIPPDWQRLLKVQLLLQVCEGLAVLHRVGVVHCDVKLDNVWLAFDETCRPFRIAAKLGDLGMCRYVEPSRAQPHVVRAHGPAAGMLSAYTILVKGTPGYCAPEMLEFGRLAPATDIYSMTVLITLALAPESEFVWHEAWIMKLQPKCPKDMSPVLVSTLRKGLSFVKEERPALQDLVSALTHEQSRLCALTGCTADG